MTSNQVENKTEMTSKNVENCPVCYAELTLKNVMNMRCTHQLCKDCFFNWVDETGKNSCPCCRDEIMKSENFMKDEKLRAEVAIERMEFAAEVWKEKRDKKRKQYFEASVKAKEEEDKYMKCKKRRREETYETAKVLTLQTKYWSKINELSMRVSISLSPYDCRDYYQKKMDEKGDYTEKKARSCFKEVLKEMKEVFGCYMSGKGRSSYCEDILMLIDGMKFTKQLDKEFLGETIYFADMFDNEIEVDEDKMKYCDEYDDYCDKMRKKEKIYADRRRESIGMLMEDGREEQVVYREIDWDYQIEKKYRQYDIDVMSFDKNYYKKNMEWANTVWNKKFPNGEHYLYTEERNGKKVCVKGTKEITDINEVLPPINRGLWYRQMIKNSRKMMNEFQNEEYEDLNLNDMFNELEDGEITEFDSDFADMPELESISDTESIDSNEIHYGFMSYDPTRSTRMRMNNFSAIDWSADVGNNVVASQEPEAGERVARIDIEWWHDVLNIDDTVVVIREVSDNELTNREI